MANADKPAGFRVGYTKHGGPAALNRYFASGTGAIYRGDVVTHAAVTGHIKTLLGASLGVPIGIASNYTVGTSTDDEVLCYDDFKNTVFIGQDSGTAISSSTLCFAFYDITMAVSTTTQQSIMEINSAASVSDNIFLIDKVDRPDNDWGAYVDCYVEFTINLRAHGTAVDTA